MKIVLLFLLGVMTFSFGDGSPQKTMTHAVLCGEIGTCSSRDNCPWVKRLPYLTMDCPEVCCLHRDRSTGAVLTGLFCKNLKGTCTSHYSCPKAQQLPYKTNDCPEICCLPQDQSNGALQKNKQITGLFCANLKGICRSYCTKAEKKQPYKTNDCPSACCVPHYLTNGGLQKNIQITGLFCANLKGTCRSHCPKAEKKLPYKTNDCPSACCVPHYLTNGALQSDNPITGLFCANLKGICSSRSSCPKAQQLPYKTNDCPEICCLPRDQSKDTRIIPVIGNACVALNGDCVPTFKCPDPKARLYGTDDCWLPLTCCVK